MLNNYFCELWRVSEQVRVALASNRRKTDSVRREGIQRRNLQNSRFSCLLYRYKIMLYRYNQRGECLLYRYKGILYRYKLRAQIQLLSVGSCTGTGAVYRYKGVLVESPVGDFVADVAPRAVRARLLPELCEEAGRGSVFTVLDVALRFDVVEVARSPRRNVGSRRGLVRWIRDFKRNSRSPHLPDLVKLVHRTWRSPVDPAEVVLVRGFVRCLDLAFEVGYIGFTPNLIELDRDTLHTRLGSAHECHSGVRLVLSRWCRSCQLDLLSTD
uniref:Uncharacterized protein n=1 Tax=Ananas comosus var. bracteatus TaxID=296719 RepID=A0A6V7NXE0_ANACO|nr:unnamed protein product [Ananas comosus var. bracteatus]